MRRIIRTPLAEELATYLDEQQKELDASRDVEPFWKAKRRSSQMKRVAKHLSEMAGTRSRCMYCEDSRATDVEHFRPKQRFPNFAFRWSNFLWICSGCNRQKGEQFTEDPVMGPLLVDPTLDDPWNIFYFDSSTALLAARWIDDPARPHPRGKYTLEVLSVLDHEAVAEGRRRTRRSLARAVKHFLNHTERDGLSDPIDRAHDLFRELVEAIIDADAYGLADWFFVRDGLREEPFSTFAELFPTTLVELRGTLIRSRVLA